MILNANHIAEEAEIVANAGKMNKVTVSTNMAGRGTDIKLGEGVSAIGGLHVIVTEMHDRRASIVSWPDVAVAREIPARIGCISRWTTICSKAWDPTRPSATKNRACQPGRPTIWPSCFARPRGPPRGATFAIARS